MEGIPTALEPLSAPLMRATGLTSQLVCYTISDFSGGFTSDSGT